MNGVFLAQLKQEVELRCGFNVRQSKDCIHLSECIYQSIKQNISPNTLRSVWGIEKSGFSISSSTIEILRMYVGDNSIPDSVLDFEVDFVRDFYRPNHFEGIDFNDKTFQASCRKIAVLLKANSALFHRIMEDLASNKVSQKFYFDLFPDYDILHLFQYKGFLLYWEYTHDPNDQLYIASILTRAYYFRGDQTNVELWSSRAFDIFKSHNSNFHSFTLGRFFFAMLISCGDADYQSWLSRAEKMEREIPRGVSGNFNEFPGFHYMICDAFYLKGDFRSLVFFAEKALQDFEVFEEYTWKGYYDQLKVYKAFGDYHLEKNPEKIKAVAKMDTSGYYFISKNYFQKIHMELMKYLV
ncbi:MAG: hypothetical protein FJX95_06980 [Bacteroidetes bacterium]|nr:hypothetical protein [Bacteroidota bacterium]